MKKNRLIKIIIAVVVAFACFVIFVVMTQMNQANQLTVDEISMEQVVDGIYIGEVETVIVKVKVEVEVKDSKIINIEILEHQNGLGSEAEKMIEDMIKENHYDVDVVSGATVSSKVIKSAVFEALKNGIKE